MTSRDRLGLALLLILVSGLLAAAAQVQLQFPLSRVAYQTNELIDIDVVRSDTQALPAGLLTLTVTGNHGGAVTMTFPVKAVPVVNGEARATEHLHVNGWYLRPGAYDVLAAVDGANATGAFELYSHVRKSTFMTGDWSTRADAKKGEQRALGQDSLGFNFYYTLYGGYNPDDAIRGGLDYFWCCTLGGGHQVDLRLEHDWSDPYVLRGAFARAGRRALEDRTYPNTLGVHLFDEPGLTWFLDPATGTMSPHTVLPQWLAYEAAFGDDPGLFRPVTDAELTQLKTTQAKLEASDNRAEKSTANRLAPFVAMAELYRKVPTFYKTLDPKNPAQVEKWTQWAYWKLGFMDAAWKFGQHEVTRVNDKFLALTQSQYAPIAFTDGHYFNVTRSLPINSGHGGYDGVENGYFNPMMTLEVTRAHDLVKPNWYLPLWYNTTAPEIYRLEQYSCFITDLQGMLKPPDMQVHTPEKCPQADSIVETNKTMAQLGTIFTNMPVTRPPVALLYSLSHIIHQQTQQMDITYGHQDNHWQSFKFCYTAGQMMQQPFMPVLDEDVQDGTLAAYHQAVIVPSVTYLAPEVVSALEDFAANGGLVLVTADTTVAIKGATKLHVSPGWQPDLKARADALEQRAKAAAKEEAAKLNEEARGLLSIGGYMTSAEPIIKAVAPVLAKAGITPVFTCDNTGILARQQGYGDITYLFAVNAAFDYQRNLWNATRPTTATLGIAAGDRAIYDAVRGGAVAEFAGVTAQKGVVSAPFRFGAGQMRAFALTARPLGGVRVGTPRLIREYLKEQAPITVSCTATLVDTQGSLLSGAAPLRIVVTDPLGDVRYDLFRATENGVCTVALPLAANDPAGAWTLAVTELLNHTGGQTTFTYQPVKRLTALAGATPRAVYFGNDRENIYRLFHEQKDVTIVTGTSPYLTAAAERLAKILAPWGVRSQLVTAAEVNKQREMTPEEKTTWPSMDKGSWTGAGSAGFPIANAAILLGTPEDNPLIKFAVDRRLLAYMPKKGIFPGNGRGFLGWQRDMIGSEQESVTLVAYDEVGMAEAVGSLYEAVAGIDPLTPLNLPSGATVTPAGKALRLPAGEIAWQTVLPDRPRWLAADHDVIRACTLDGSLITLDKDGKVQARQDASADDLAVPAAKPQVPDSLQQALAAGFLVKFTTPCAGTRTAVGYWGGLLQVFDTANGNVALQRHFAQDISGLAGDGQRLVVALADGRVLAVTLP